MTTDNKNQDIHEALQNALLHAGPDRVLQALVDLTANRFEDDYTLTIVSNDGVHHLPNEYRRGEVYFASHGTLDFSTSESIHNSFYHVLSQLAVKLKSKEWRAVYVVPFGPTALSMQIKLLIYRICGVESIDVMHVAGGPRTDINLHLRQLIVNSTSV